MYFSFFVSLDCAFSIGSAGAWLCWIGWFAMLFDCSISFLNMISATWSPTASSLSSALKKCFLKDSTISFLSITMLGFVLSFHAEDISLCPSSRNMFTIVV